MPTPNNYVEQPTPVIDPDEATIIYPMTGDTVSGKVTIEGTVSFSKFDSYGILFAEGAEPTSDSQWTPIVYGEDNKVMKGPLATWDTTEVSNGKYTLVLAIYVDGNETPQVRFVENITVSNP